MGVSSIIQDPEPAQPPLKRARRDDADTAAVTKSSNSRLFAPFRALGMVTNHVPFVLQTRSHKGATNGPRVHILTCLGRSWALWEGGKMSLLFVGPEALSSISCLLMDGDAVWAACGCFSIKYLRGKEVQRLSNPLGSSLAFMTVLGSHLLALVEDGTRMIIWNTSNGEFESSVKFEAGFTATTILHPATYLNKVLVASSEGSMQLWNIRTQSCIHNFTTAHLLSATPSKSHDSAAITALTQSPAIDVVGIGFSSGEISVYDVRADERLMRMFMDGGPVRSLGFRSDGQSVLASASSSGHLALWDLNEGGRLLHMVKGAHDGAITHIEWVPGQPVLVTSGEDNSVKQWLFDSPTAIPRLLRYRSGHHAPPHLIRYYGDDGKQLLTASRDRSLRCTSVVRDSRSFEMSQGSLSKKASKLSVPVASLKFPPITAISFSTTRAKDWDDIVTVQTDEIYARTWTMLGKRLGKHTFASANIEKGKNKDRPPGPMKAVCVTACGNFAIGSSSTGAINMWNMQSGIKRRSFDVGPCPPETANRFHKPSGNKQTGRCVTGLATDALNTVVIASTLDGTLNFFDFHTAKLEHTLVLSSAATSILLQRDSGLLAVICDDMLVRVVDIETKRIVRELSGFRARVLDITFSPDSRWLITTSLDSIIRTFDLPTGRLIDAFQTSSVATSVAFSPTNDFLATAHVDSVGIYLWANRAQYSNVSFQTVTEEDIVESPLPTMQGSGEDDDTASLEALSALTVTEKPVDIFSTPPQLDGNLITLTLLPRSRWQTLLNLEVIQQRNKPKDPPKAPEQTPFFLPTLPGVETRFAVDEKGQEDSKKSNAPSHRLDKATLHSLSNFYQKLAEEKLDGDYEAFFNYAKTLSPAATDLEIRSLTSLKGLHLFSNALIQRLISHRDFEAVQTYLKVFLHLHADVIIANPELQLDLARLYTVQQEESERILELLASSLGTLSFVRDTL